MQIENLRAQIAGTLASLAALEGVKPLLGATKQERNRMAMADGFLCWQKRQEEADRAEERDFAARVDEKGCARETLKRPVREPLPLAPWEPKLRQMDELGFPLAGVEPEPLLDGQRRALHAALAPERQAASSVPASELPHRPWHAVPGAQVEIPTHEWHGEDARNLASEELRTRKRLRFESVAHLKRIPKETNHARSTDGE